MPPGGFGSSGDGSSDNSGSGQTATAKQSVGIVDINSSLSYQGAEGAGTGMVLDSSGDILTNNHVVNGSTSLKVTIVSTGKTYTAKVVGTDPTQDIAVIKLDGASGLATANFGDSDSVKVGDTVTGVGNAGGVGGTPSSATGQVTALHQSITASDEGANAEKLSGLIQSNADIQAGDSGGPLYNSNDKIVGVDTAASSSGQSQGYSIPINTARSIANQILSGNETTSIHIGYPAFLGISVSSDSAANGVVVGGVVNGLPAANAGIVAGDQITKVGSTDITSASKLTSKMATYQPGDRTKVTYIDANGQSHTVTVTLATGPAD